MSSSALENRAIDTAQDARKRRLPLRGFAHLDALRAGAVMLVVVSHAGVAVVPGGSGVTVFFVISGFIITHLLLREYERDRSFDALGFYSRRALKIFPPLLVIVIVPSLIYGAVRAVSWFDVAGQLLFFFNWAYVDSRVSVLPGSVVVWSLSIEEQFYLVVALIWLLLVSRRHPVLGLRILAWGLIVYSMAARVVLYLGGATADRIYFGTDSRMEAIAVGVLVALWYRRRRTEPARDGAVGHGEWLGRDVVPLLALVLYLLSLVIREEFFRETARYSVQAVAAALIIMWGLVGARGALGRTLTRVMKLQIVQLLGLASYSIYLAHYTLMRAAEPLLAGTAAPVAAIVSVILGTAGGVLAWWLIEEPVVRWRHRRRARRGVW